MKIGIVGLGYMGSITAVALAEAGYEVVGIDIDSSKIESLSKSEPAIYEPNLKELLSKHVKMLSFYTDYNKLSDVGMTFVVVPTPTKDNKIYLKYVEEAVNSIKEVNKGTIIIIKSTVLPGTARELMNATGMRIISNPEFTKEGTAIYDTLHPDRIVIGGSDRDAMDAVKNLWSFTNSPVIETTNENAEMIKYASNSFLAVKISFINEIANLCEKIPSCDVQVIAKGMGLDKRIAPYFLSAGIGFGGSCFPKDTRAFVSFARGIGEDLSIINDAVIVNENRVKRVFDILNQNFKDNKPSTQVGILGLTFKANTDDTRESQAIKLISLLKHDGYKVNVYDPMAKENLEGVTWFESAYECAKNSDAVVVATEWEEFKDLVITNKMTIDMKRILNPSKVNNLITVGVYG